MVNNTSFGTHIKLARHGYAYSNRMNGYMRLSDVSNGFLIELLPNNPSHDWLTKNDFPYRIWWDEENEIIDLSPTLKSIKSVKKVMSFIVNQSGVLIKEPSQ